MNINDGDTFSIPQLSEDSELGSWSEQKGDCGKDEESHGSEHETEPWIRYCIEWRDRNNHLRSRHEVTENEVDISTLDGAEPHYDDPAFERVSVFRTNFDEHNGPRAAPLTKIPDASRSSLALQKKYYVRILSVSIIHALRSVVRYYPGQDLSGAYVDISWPYPVLVHHYSELFEFLEALKEKEPESLCIRERDGVRDLDLLFDFLDKEVMEKVNAEKERHKRGFDTFDYKWVAWKPGTTILSSVRESEKGEFTPAVIHSVQGGIFSQQREKWMLSLWSMDYNGQYLGRVRRTLFDSEYDGESSTNSIRVLGSVGDFDKAWKDVNVLDGIEQGRIFWDLLNCQCRYHDGKTVGLHKTQVEGMVMVDINSYYSEKRREDAKERRAEVNMRPPPPPPPPGSFAGPYANIEASNDHIPVLMDDSDQRNFISDCPCHVCINGKGATARKTAIFESYDRITLTSNRQPNDHQYFLCPKHIPAFVFKTRTWEKVWVKNLSAPRFQQKMIERLVMDEGSKGTIRSLTGSFARLNHKGQKLVEKPWAADYVDGKGNGLIFLLHGGPGVGKTFTAECIANLLERPLMVLTTTDIGTKPEDVEENLTRKFKRAKSWNAVLLVDEADVFVANRTIKDLHRSSLVASFLRALEFYDGILFLTTNRVGAFDDAILSRVHVQIYYPNLNRQQRYEVWKTFIDKLQDDRPSMLVRYAVKEYLSSSEMRDYEMNGREIRNAFQTAVALAEHRAEEGEGGKTLLTEEHLKEVVELGRSFKTYFSDLHGGSESKRAFDRGERLDSLIKVLEENI